MKSQNSIRFRSGSIQDMCAWGEVEGRGGAGNEPGREADRDAGGDSVRRTGLREFRGRGRSGEGGWASLPLR